VKQGDGRYDNKELPVRASLKPKPHLRSGAIALPEPEPEESSNASERSILIWTVWDSCAIACEEATDDNPEHAKKEEGRYKTSCSVFCYR
jgi:hypothetical protein